MRRHLIQNMDCNNKWLNHLSQSNSTPVLAPQCNILPNSLNSSIGSGLPTPFCLIINNVIINDDNVACHQEEDDSSSSSSSSPGIRVNHTVSNLKTTGLLEYSNLKGKRKFVANEVITGPEGGLLSHLDQLDNDECTAIHAIEENVTPYSDDDEMDEMCPMNIELQGISVSRPFGNNIHQEFESNNALPPSNGPIGPKADNPQLVEPVLLIDDPAFVIHGGRTILPQDRLCMKLYAILASISAPRYVYDQIIKIFQETMLECEGIAITKAYSRERLVKRAQDLFPTPKPMSIPIALEGLSTRDIEYQRHFREVVQLQVFDFPQQMEDLFQGNIDLFTNTKNLVLNVEDPFSKYIPPEGRLLEIMDGDRYQEAHASLCIDESKGDFLCPIVMYCDKTGIDKMNRYGLEPVTVTVGFLSEEARRDPNVWKTIALIPDMELTSSATKSVHHRGVSGHGRAIRNLHKVWEAALSSFVKSQEEGHEVMLTLGNKAKFVKIKYYLAFVMGDAKSNDALTGRYGGHKTTRMCRACDCNFNNSWDPWHKCTPIFQKDMKQLLDRHFDSDTPVSEVAFIKNVLNKKLSTHVSKNAFHQVDFGENPDTAVGIYGNTPTDLMHAFLEGVLKYAIKIFFKPFTPIQLVAIDQTVDELFGSLRSSSKDDIGLRSNFTHGITNLTLLTANEWIGVAFTLLCLSRTKKGMNVLSPNLCDDDYRESREHDKESRVSRTDETVTEICNDEESPDHKCSRVNFIECLEAILCFHAWYKVGAPYNRGVNNSNFAEWDKSIRHLLDMIQSAFPRVAGYKWNLQKLHEMLHLIGDIRKHGPPMNYDASTGESGLRSWAKDPGATSQKQGPETFTQQVAMRIWESSLMRKMNTEVFRYTRKNIVPPPTAPLTCLVGKPKYVIETNNGTARCEWLGKLQQILLPQVHPIVIATFARWFQNIGACRICCWTELIINGQRMRAHPNYQSKGEWYDWAMIRFNGSTQPREEDSFWLECDFPAKIVAILSAPLKCYKDDIDSGTSLEDLENKFITGVLVLCTEEPLSDDGESCLCQQYNVETRECHIQNSNKERIKVLRPKLRLVSIESIVERVFVVEETPGLREHYIASPDPSKNATTDIVLVKNRRRVWVNEF